METYKRNSLTPVAGAIAAALYPGSYAVAQEAQEAGEYALEEVIVTATKRQVNIQAHSGAASRPSRRQTWPAWAPRSMEDYTRFIPSLNVVSYGSGSSTIVFRGAITGSELARPGYIVRLP